MRANQLIASAGTVIALAPQPAHSQGLPDIVWEVGDHTHSVSGVAYAPDGSFITPVGEERPSSVRTPFPLQAP